MGVNIYSLSEHESHAYQTAIELLQGDASSLILQLCVGPAARLRHHSAIRTIRGHFAVDTGSLYPALGGGAPAGVRQKWIARTGKVSETSSVLRAYG